MNLKQWKVIPKSEQKRLLKLVEFETQARKNGYRVIGGTDEVGRGPLAGPVVAATCILAEGFFFPGIKESKQLSPAKRKAIYQTLISHPDISYGVGIIEVDVIDRINIHQASLLAMKESVVALKKKPDLLLVDGVKLAIEGVECLKIIKGDTLSQSIAIASIIAKEIRDELMRDYHEHYPEYGFNENKGYATKNHREKLNLHGPCPIHRRSFAPVRICSKFSFYSRLSINS